MGAGYSTETALDDEARAYIEQQTRDDLDLLLEIDYCNEVVEVVAAVLGAVAWPPEFDFKGRVFTPNNRTFSVLAKYYVQVAQMFGAAVRARVPALRVRHLFDWAFREQTYYAPPAALELHQAVLRAVAAPESSVPETPRCLALARNYGLALQARAAPAFQVGFPQIGDLERCRSDLKEKIKSAAEKTRAADVEIQWRGEVLVSRLYFDLLSKKIEYLENL